MKGIVMKGVLKILMVFILLSFSSCLYDDDWSYLEPEVFGTAKINLKTTVSGQELNFNDYLSTKSGNRIRFTKIKFFLGNTAFTNREREPRGTTRFGLLEPSAGINEWTLDRMLIGDYKGLSFNIGIDSASNHRDPATYPGSHVLNPLVHQGMFWDWNAGYIFIKLEGKYITTAGDTSNFLYHIGKDINRMPFDFNLEKELSAGETINYNLELDVYKLMSEPNEFDINVAGAISHTTVGDVTKVPVLVENLKAALKLN